MNPWHGKRIALVLSGGGGKGAYQIGCWKALERAGISNFTALSGTSIGAINACLIARGDYARAEQLWLDLGRETPLPKSLLRLVIALIERYGVAVIYAFWSSPILTLPALVGLLIWLSLAAWAGWLSTASPFKILLLPLALGCILGAERMLVTRWGRIFAPGHNRRSFQEFIRAFNKFTSAGFFVGPLVGIIFPLPAMSEVIQTNGSFVGTLVIFTYFILSGLVLLIPEELGISSLSSISLLSGRRLKSLLQSELIEVESGCEEPNIYISRLVETSVKMPDEKRVSFNPQVHEEIEVSNPWKTEREIEEEMIYTGRGTDLRPVYENILGLEYVEISGLPVLKWRVILADTVSIAGFLPADSAYDAGRIDNLPIAPLLQLDLDLIIVIFLKKIKFPIPFLQRHLSHIDKKIRRLNTSLTQQRFDKLEDVELLHPARRALADLRKVYLMPIVPGRNLGGFWSTLKFSTYRVRHLLKLGEDDAKRALDAFARENPGWFNKG